MLDTVLFASLQVLAVFVYLRIPKQKLVKMNAEFVGDFEASITVFD